MEFLDDKGKPTSKLITEAANIFITDEARNNLVKSGAMILKDSSANKCGVICSSYEIMASMMISPELFLEIKNDFVEDVLTRLRELALREVELLFREFNIAKGISLPEMSSKVSDCMNQASDAIVEQLEELPNTDEVLIQFAKHMLPKALLKVAEDE
eukprot:UN27090